MAALPKSASLPLVFVPVGLAIVGAAVVGLPLFQDGSSYLFELLLTGSAVRHHRTIVLLIQAPAIVGQRLLRALAIGGAWSLPVVRLLFNLSYASVPLLTLAWCWRIVRPHRPGMVIWPALVILFVNLVDFSWVSELLIAIQLAWPLLLVTLLMPGTKRHLVVTAVLLPALWSLHPLSIVLLAMIALGSADVSRREARVRRTARWNAGLLLVAALLGAVVETRSMTDYESSFLAPQGLAEYFFRAHWEDVLLLLSALAIAGICWRARSLTTTERGLRRLYGAGAGAAVGAGVVQVSQFCVATHTFPLKTGLVLLTAAAVMLLATLDGRDPCSATETQVRLRLSGLLAAVFAGVVLAKVLVWHVAVARLETSMAAAGRCLESSALPWLRHSPYSILDNWALPSLALVTQDTRPRALLLQSGDCRLYFESGMVRIDPWTLLPGRDLVPPLD